MGRKNSDLTVQRKAGYIDEEWGVPIPSTMYRVTNMYIYIPSGYLT
jgi:hypothetical protein